VTFLRAIAYFFREASINTARGWRVSLLAVFTIAVSLFVGGLFLLVSANLGRAVEAWRGQARLVVYVRPDLPAEERARVRSQIARAPWVREVREVDSAQAKQRFREIFPGMADLVEGWSEDPLPPSFEVEYEAAQADPRAFAAWQTELRGLAAVSMVDDDRDWLRQLEAVIALVRGIGLTLGAVLLGGAILTIASVIRLTAYLYSEEIAIQRLVGGTEFFIRGPFYAEGLLQGLTGGVLALGALWGAFAIVRPQAGASLLAWIFADRFLTPGAALGLAAVGAAAGLVGAVLSLRREQIGRVVDE
jgi:cell division transport system permease protein